MIPTQRAEYEKIQLSASGNSLLTGISTFNYKIGPETSGTIFVQVSIPGFFLIPPWIDLAKDYDNLNRAFNKQDIKG